MDSNNSMLLLDMHEQKEEPAAHQVIIEAIRVSDNTASDAWRPTPNGTSAEIDAHLVDSIDCTIRWCDQGWGH